MPAGSGTPSATARRAMSRIRICSHTTGSQQHPTSTYIHIAPCIHGMVTRRPSFQTSRKPSHRLHQHGGGGEEEIRAHHIGGDRRDHARITTAMRAPHEKRNAGTGTEQHREETMCNHLSSR